MDTSRRAKRGKQKITPQSWSQQESDGVEERDNRLKKLLAFVSHLKRTPPGAAELQRRKQLFGECTRGESESADQFYRRLRYWLDRKMPDLELSLYVQSKID